LAHSLDIHAIAEGVANEDEFEMDDRLGLDGASGPLIRDKLATGSLAANEGGSESEGN
jgi:EAL domain-containing protein (putative c-di-GMP-specific phosphodiesterase class I)